MASRRKGTVVSAPSKTITVTPEELEKLITAKAKDLLGGVLDKLQRLEDKLEELLTQRSPSSSHQVCAVSIANVPQHVRNPRTPEGLPICLNCKGIGHVSKHCRSKSKFLKRQKKKEVSVDKQDVYLIQRKEDHQSNAPVESPIKPVTPSNPSNQLDPDWEDKLNHATTFVNNFLKSYKQPDNSTTLHQRPSYSVLTLNYSNPHQPIVNAISNASLDQLSPTTSKATQLLNAIDKIFLKAQSSKDLDVPKVQQQLRTLLCDKQHIPDQTRRREFKKQIESKTTPTQLLDYLEYLLRSFHKVFAPELPGVSSF